MKIAVEETEFGSTLQDWGWIVKQALADWIPGKEEPRRMTLEAMADVDCGRFVEHEEMIAWAESLDTDRPLPLPIPQIRLPRESGDPAFLLRP